MAANISEDFWRCPYCQNIYHFFNENDITEHNDKCGKKEQLIKELKSQEKSLEEFTNQSLTGHLHINKNEIELRLLSQRQLRNSIADKETELHELHRRSWTRAETNGSIKSKTQLCRACPHSHSQIHDEHNYAAFENVSSKNSPKKPDNGGKRQ